MQLKTPSLDKLCWNITASSQGASGFKEISESLAFTIKFAIPHVRFSFKTSSVEQERFSVFCWKK